MIKKILRPKESLLVIGAILVLAGCYHAYTLLSKAMGW